MKLYGNSWVPSRLVFQLCEASSDKNGLQSLWREHSSTESTKCSDITTLVHSGSGEEELFPGLCDTQEHPWLRDTHTSAWGCRCMDHLCRSPDFSLDGALPSPVSSLQVLATLVFPNPFLNCLLKIIIQIY